jgi:pyruvate dehydrogenase E2 component (dihydrolipoamide acetyltransferase)
MPIEVRVPQLADSMKSARLAVWLKREGDVISAGEPIAELETDKTNVEIEAPGSGVLQRICVPAGAEVPEAGGLLALIGDTEPVGGDPDTVGEVPAPAPILVEPQSSSVPAQDAPSGARHSERAVQPIQLAKSASGTQVSSQPDAKRPVTPLARRMAELTGLDIDTISGSGPAGRIGKADIERRLQERQGSHGVVVPARRVEPPASSAAPDARGPFEDRPLSPMRRVTAARLAEAKQTVPHFYLQIDCDVDLLAAMRTSLNSPGTEAGVTLTDCVVRAAALALRSVPSANSAWTGTGVRVYGKIDIALAVNTSAGLITPVIRDADTKGLRAIAGEVKALVERAREGRLQPAEYTGATFTISNLGMYGVTSLYPIVNPPQSCILGVGAAVAKPVIRHGAVAVGTVMTCTLSGDHRVIDGATGAELLAEFRRIIQNPWLLAI